MRWRFWRRQPPDLILTNSNQLRPTSTDYNPDDEPAPLGDVQRRGVAAERLLNDPTLAEAFRELREDLYSEWMFSEPKQSTRREELYYEAHALNKVTGKLIAYRAAARIRRDSAA